MTTGDYVLWFGSLTVLLLMGLIIANLLKFAVHHVQEWWIGCVLAAVLYVILVAAVLSPTYYLVLRN